jgi:hypothetical protein
MIRVADMPVFRGVTGAIEIFDGPSADESIFSFVGCFDNVATAFVLRFVLKTLVMRPVLKKAAKEFAQGIWEGKPAPV